MTDEQERAFEQVYNDYYPRIYARVLSLIRHPQEAEDLTQDTFMKVYRVFATLDMSNFRAWLYRVATNTVYDALRRRRRIAFSSLDADGERFHPQSSDVQEDYAQREAIHLALSGLNETQRDLLLLHEVQGYKAIELASSSGQTYDTVTSTIRRARRAFKQQYEVTTAS